jgi:hypothetical protein
MTHNGLYLSHDGSVFEPSWFDFYNCMVQKLHHYGTFSNHDGSNFQPSWFDFYNSMVQKLPHYGLITVALWT